MESQLDLREVLDYIDPGSLNYSEWVNVGMGLHKEGYPLEVWDEWSAKDGPRYHRGECARKWATFRGSTNPVTGGTIVQMAKDRGWSPAREDRALEWDDIIGSRDDLVVVNKDWVEGQEVIIPEEWRPAAQLIRYLETLFHADELVGYVTESFVRDGRHLPTKGCWDRTAGQLIASLRRCGDDLGSVLGDYDPGAGAWIRFNPLDGQGVGNSNVTDYRYALVESDAADIARQNAIIRELELPVAALVHSGNKSLHAIVRVDAMDYDEYRKRVDYLYKVCIKNGLEIDQQNRNPSRLSRMPGAMRAGRKQYLLDTNIGKANWAEWYEWIESVNDDLPEPESMADAWDHLPELSPPLIHGVLRQGHKMLLAGPSKAGKSYALIELCCAIAEGRSWMGWNCAQGRVMYVNLELDRASCLHRFKDVYSALGWTPAALANIDIWNLRGKSVPMDKLAPKLIRRAAKKEYIAIVIDPIYKVITGDENSADQMAHFCNQFDRVCTELGCAVIYCHHHSKGAQGGKRSMDRASGSGVFARDPDALLDLIELPLNEDALKQEVNKAVCAACADYLEANVPAWQNNVSQDDLCSHTAMLAACLHLLTETQYADLKGRVSEREGAVRQKSAWRIDGTLREFPKFAPVNVWFDYPIHRADGVGVLADIEPDSEQPPWKKASKAKEKRDADQAQADRIAFENAVNLCNFGEPPTIPQLMESLNKSERTIKRYVGKFGYCVDEKSGKVVKRNTAAP